MFSVSLTSSVSTECFRTSPSTSAHRAPGHRRHQQAEEHAGQGPVDPRVVKGKPQPQASGGVGQRALHPQPRPDVDHQRQQRDPAERPEMNPAPVEQGDDEDAADVVEDGERGEEDDERAGAPGR